MSRPLPAWVVDDAESVRAEAAPYVDMPIEQRVRDLKAACRAAVRILAARSDAAAALSYRDPLPESTVLALARLRERGRKRSDG